MRFFLNLGSVAQEISFKIFFIFLALAAIFSDSKVKLLVILKEGIMGNFCVKLFFNLG